MCCGIAAKLFAGLKLILHRRGELRFVQLQRTKRIQHRLRGMDGMMRDVIPDVHIKRTFLVLLDEADRLVIHRRIAPASIHGMSMFFRCPLIRADDINAIRPGLQHGPHVPFAKVPGGIAIFFQQLRDGDPTPKTITRRILLKRCGKLPRHQPRARRTAGDTRGMEFRKSCAIRRQLVQVRRLRIRMPIAVQIAPAQIICENENDVRRCGMK